ncbi:hypothetical protein RN001_013019 [Aquatica leii]|uniref:Uncharacterized protein n=1 Tax=Aquatica leii TaxID=1421715 RepID=A0AAN7SDK8_9COLE|nr:hypothetical protein RN001_013019 [Aquatica leii]
MNVVSHNVHRVLYTKYPSPQEPSKPDVPSVNVAACVSGLPNTSVLPVLQKLLKKRRVRVIEMQDAINNCLNAFHDESKIEEIDDGLITETKATLKVLNKEIKPVVPQKESKSSKCVIVVEEKHVPSFEEKGMQTPIVYPNEEVVLSRRGELEEALTGCQIPNVSNLMDMSFSIGDIADLDFREPQLDVEERNAILRKSRILPNPVDVSEKQAYRTYLTAYIRIKHESVREEEDEEGYVEPPIDEFYYDQGCNYSLYYDEFRFAQIKRLAKMILGKYSVPPKTSFELFGDTVLFLESTLGSPKKETKPKSDTNENINLSEEPSPTLNQSSTILRIPRAGEMLIIVRRKPTSRICTSPFVAKNYCSNFLVKDFKVAVLRPATTPSLKWVTLDNKS